MYADVKRIIGSSPSIDFNKIFDPIWKGIQVKNLEKEREENRKLRKTSIENADIRGKESLDIQRQGLGLRKEGLELSKRRLDISEKNAEQTQRNWEKNFEMMKQNAKADREWRSAQAKRANALAAKYLKDDDVEANKTVYLAIKSQYNKSMNAILQRAIKENAIQVQRDSNGRIINVPHNPADFVKYMRRNLNYNTTSDELADSLDKFYATYNEYNRVLSAAGKRIGLVTEDIPPVINYETPVSKGELPQEYEYTISVLQGLVNNPKLKKYTSLNFPNSPMFWKTTKKLGIDQPEMAKTLIKYYKTGVYPRDLSTKNLKILKSFANSFAEEMYEWWKEHPEDNK